MDEEGDHHQHEIRPIGVVAVQHVAHGEVVVGAESTETMVLGRPTAYILGKNVLEVQLIVIPHVTMGG